MAEIIALSDFQKSKKERRIVLTDLLKDAVVIAKKSYGEISNEIFQPSQSIENLFKIKINSMLLESGQINAELFNCGSYIARIINQFQKEVPESYYAVDYFVRGVNDDNPLVLQKGADLCFIICVFFEQRKKWRKMGEDYYPNLGKQLYYMFYDKTKKTIGLHMRYNFKTIAEITRDCVKNL